MIRQHCQFLNLDLVLDIIQSGRLQSLLLMAVPQVKVFFKVPTMRINHWTPWKHERRSVEDVSAVGTPYDSQSVPLPGICAGDERKRQGLVLKY